MKPVSVQPLRFVKAERGDRVPTAHRLVEASARGDKRAGERFLTDAGVFGIDTTGLWGAFPADGGRVVRHAFLGVPGAGKTLTIFVSQPTNDTEAAELSGLIDHATREEGVGRLAQVLLEPGDAFSLSAFLGAGFIHVADLAYLSRPRPGPEFDPPTDWGAGIRVRGWMPGDDPALADALGRTYEGTLDCPDMCGMREPAEVIASHRATGVFDPNLWWLVEHDGRCEGVMLFNPCPAQSSVELVYLGLAPTLRGCGMARRLMQLGLARIASREEREVTCAVDLRNTPAMRLYKSFGFLETSRRVALVRPSRAV